MQKSEVVSRKNETTQSTGDDRDDAALVRQLNLSIELRRVFRVSSHLKELRPEVFGSVCQFYDT